MVSPGTLLSAFLAGKDPVEILGFPVPGVKV